MWLKSYYNSNPAVGQKALPTWDRVKHVHAEPSPEVSTLPSLVAISLVTVQIQILQIVT